MKREVIVTGLILILGMSCISTAQAEEEEGCGMKAAKATVAGVATGVGATSGLTAAGFTASGIAGGSVVAGLQSLAATGTAGVATSALSAAGFTATGIASGSLIAGLQSVAATGGLIMTGPIGIGVGVVGGGLYYIFG